MRDELIRHGKELARHGDAVGILIEISFDSWRHDTNSEPSQVGGTDREKVADFYGQGKDLRGAKELTCMVTRAKLSESVVIAGHLVSKKNVRNGNGRRFLGITDANDARNIMLWCQPIETAWSRNEICFVSEPGAHASRECCRSVAYHTTHF